MVVTNLNRYYINKLIKTFLRLRQGADNVNSVWKNKNIKYCITIDNNCIAQTLFSLKLSSFPVDDIIEHMDTSPLWAAISQDLSTTVIKGTDEYFTLELTYSSTLRTNLGYFKVDHIEVDRVGKIGKKHRPKGIIAAYIDLTSSSMIDMHHFNKEYFNDYKLAPIFKHNKQLGLPYGSCNEESPEITDDTLTNNNLW